MMKGLTSKQTRVEARNCWLITGGKIRGPYETVAISCFSADAEGLRWLITTGKPKDRWQNNRNVFFSREDTERALPQKLQEMAEAAEREKKIRDYEDAQCL